MNSNRTLGIFISVTILIWVLIFALSPQPKYQKITNINIPELPDPSVDKDTLLNSITTDEVFAVSEEKLVSADYIGTTTPSILDKSCTMQLTPQTIKFALWYDNEWSFCTQMIRMVKIMHHKIKLYSKTTK